MAPAEGCFFDPSFPERGHSIKVGSQSPGCLGHSMPAPFKRVEKESEDQACLYERPFKSSVQPEIASVFLEVYVSVTTLRVTPATGVHRHAELQPSLNIQCKSAVKIAEPHPIIARQGPAIAKCANALLNLDFRHHHIPGPVYPIALTGAYGA